MMTEHPELLHLRTVEVYLCSALQSISLDDAKGQQFCSIGEWPRGLFRVHQKQQLCGAVRLFFGLLLLSLIRHCYGPYGALSITWPPFRTRESARNLRGDIAISDDRTVQLIKSGSISINTFPLGRRLRSLPRPQSGSRDNVSTNSSRTSGRPLGFSTGNHDAVLFLVALGTTGI